MELHVKSDTGISSSHSHPSSWLGFGQELWGLFLFFPLNFSLLFILWPFCPKWHPDVGPDFCSTLKWATPARNAQPRTNRQFFLEEREG